MHDGPMLFISCLSSRLIGQGRRRSKAPSADEGFGTAGGLGTDYNINVSGTFAVTRLGFFHPNVAVLQHFYAFPCNVVRRTFILAA